MAEAKDQEGVFTQRRICPRYDTIAKPWNTRKARSKQASQSVTTVRHDCDSIDRLCTAQHGEPFRAIDTNSPGGLNTFGKRDRRRGWAGRVIICGATRNRRCQCAPISISNSAPGAVEACHASVSSTSACEGRVTCSSYNRIAGWLLRNKSAAAMTRVCSGAAIRGAIVDGRWSGAAWATTSAHDGVEMTAKHRCFAPGPGQSWWCTSCFSGCTSAGSCESERAKRQAFLLSGLQPLTRLATTILA